MFIYTLFDQLKLLLQLPQGGDMWIYKFYADNMLAGKLPYIGFHPEYPPLAFLFIYAPYLINKDPLFYQFLYGLGVFGGIIIGASVLIAWTKNFNRVWLYLLLLMILQANAYHLVFERFDIFAADFTLIGLYLFFKRHKENAGWFFLFLATMTKVYPIILIPLLLYKAKKKIAILWFILPMLIANGLLLYLTHGQYTDFLLKQLNRPVELESVSASFLLGLHLLNNFTVTPIYALNSWGLVVPIGTQHILQAVIFLLLLIPLVITRKRLLPYHPVRLTVICVLFFILSNSVLSPQYLIWLIPFIGFLTTPESILFILITAITSWTFYYWDAGVSTLNQWILLLLVVRNFLLIIFYYLVILKPKWLEFSAKIDTKVQSEKYNIIGTNQYIRAEL